MEDEFVVDEEEIVDPDDLALNLDLFNEDVVGEQVVFEDTKVVSLSTTTTTTTTTISSTIAETEGEEEVVDEEDDGEGDEEPRWLKLDELMEGEPTVENDTEVTVSVLDGLTESGQDEETAYNQYLTYFSQYLIGHPGALITKTRKRPGKGAEKRYFGEAKSEDVMADKTLTGCWACGKLDHDSSDCVFKRCFVCSTQGHEMVECPNRTLWCVTCRAQGHSNENCTSEVCEISLKKTDDPDAQFCRCMKCGEEGHLHCGDVPASSSTAQSKGFSKGGFGKGGGSFRPQGAGWFGQQQMQPGSLLFPGKGGSLLRPAWQGQQQQQQQQQQQPQIFRPGGSPNIWRPPGLIPPAWAQRPQLQQFGMRPTPHPVWQQHYQQQQQEAPWGGKGGSWNSQGQQQQQQHQQQQSWNKSQNSSNGWSQASNSSWSSNGWSNASNNWQQQHQGTPSNDADWDAEVEGPAKFSAGGEEDDFDEEYEGDVDPNQPNNGNSRGQKQRGGRKYKKSGGNYQNWPREGDAGNAQKRQRWW